MVPGSDNILKRGRPAKYTGESSSQPPPSQPPPDQFLMELEDGLRGPAQIAQTYTAEEDKPEVWPVGPAEFDSKPYCKQLKGTINKLALSNCPGPIRSFSNFTKEGKENFLDDFRARYRWHHDADPATCREVLEAIAVKGYSSGLRRTRDKWIERYGMNFDKWKKDVPVWCKRPEYWIGLCDIWSSKGWQALSAKNKKNRCGAGRLVTHFSGSASAYRHSIKLKKQLGRDPTYEELYIHLHTPRDKKKKTKGKGKEVCVDAGNESADQVGPENSQITESHAFPDTKSKAVYERAVELKNDPVNSDKSEKEIWIMASGGPSHGRIYGFGGTIDKSMMPTSNARSKPNYSLGSSTFANKDPPPQRRLYTDEEVEAMFKIQEGRHRQDLAQRDQAEAERNKSNNMHFAQLYAAHGLAMPNLEAAATIVPQPLEGRMQLVENQVPQVSVVAQPLEGRTQVAENQVPSVSIQPGLNEWFGGTGYEANTFFTN